MAPVLHHFHSKDELLVAVLAERDADESRQGAAPDTGSAAPSSDLLLRHQQAPELMRLWVEPAAAASRPEHPAHAYFVDSYDVAGARLARSLQGRQGHR